MAAHCTGNGNPDRDGCCYLPNPTRVCPNRLAFSGSMATVADVLAATVLDHTGASLGTVEEFFRTEYGLRNKPGREKAAAQWVGRLWACNVFGLVFAADPNLLPQGGTGSLTQDQSNKFARDFLARPEYAEMRAIWGDWCLTFDEDGKATDPSQRRCCWAADSAAPDNLSDDGRAVAVRPRHEPSGTTS